VLERTNVRDLEPGMVPIDPAFVVADLSFVSLRPVLPTLARIAATDATAVVLVKPQFEAGRDSVGRRGVVHDPSVWRRVLESVLDAASRVGWRPLDVMASPLPGPAGNVEFLLHLRRGLGAPFQRRSDDHARVSEPSSMVDIDAAVAEGEALRG
jgi:23S rRNA (cytidine1920-2'-O)/16S rRNA (cytidine1409-2'-O)-methyltransferase